MKRFRAPCFNTYKPRDNNVTNIQDSNLQFKRLSKASQPFTLKNKNEMKSVSSS